MLKTSVKLVAKATLISLLILHLVIHIQTTEALGANRLGFGPTDEQSNEILETSKIPHRLEEFLHGHHNYGGRGERRVAKSITRAESDTKSKSIKENDADLTKSLKNLEQLILEEHIQNKMAEKDHLMMEKWLVDNINDLHRELKQTENDFEHYVQVTKRVLLRNEFRLKQQLSAATSLPLHMPINSV